MFDWFLGSLYWVLTVAEQLTNDRVIFTNSANFKSATVRFAGAQKLLQSWGGDIQDNYLL